MPKISKHIHTFSQSVLSDTVIYILAPDIIKDKEKCIGYVTYIYNAYVIGDLKMNVFLRQSIWSTNKILKEIAVLEYENVKIF